MTVAAMLEADGKHRSAFAVRLISWQKMYGRDDLPWQHCRDAYRVWLSEIMLQQTQVATVIPYYQRFLSRFPSLDRLAAAPLASVLEVWAGLGYYARARNLHRCAQRVVAEHGGSFPSEVAELARLPGIGRSTAGAIAVFAFARRAAILDGNVKRVLSRHFAIEATASATHDEQQLWALAESLLPAIEIERYTQGLMDLGATVCLRRAAQCDVCPLAGECLAQRSGRQNELPTPRKRKPLPERQVTLVLLCCEQGVLFERRPPVGIWGGLLSLPELGDRRLTDFARQRDCSILAMEHLPTVKHPFTHFILNIDVVCAQVGHSAWRVAEASEIWLTYPEIAAAALPTPIRRLLQVAFPGRAQAGPAGERSMRPIAQRPKATPPAKVTKPAVQPTLPGPPQASTATPKTTGPSRPPAKPTDE